MQRARKVRRQGGSSQAGAANGFTLLEMLVVIVIIGLLIGLVAPAVLRELGGARISIVGQSIQRLGTVLDLYKLDVGSFPSTDQGLQALLEKPADVDNWNGPYLKGSKLPVDPWNHPFHYQNPSVRQGLEYDLCSGGPNNVQGTPGENGMICNH